MQILSLQAIFLFYGIFLFSTAVLVVWLFRLQPDLSARLWIASTFVTAVATSITAFRADLPPWLGVALPNALEVGHSLTVVLSLRALIGPIPDLGRQLMGVGLAVLVYGAGYGWLAEHKPYWIVTYVSLGNGLPLLLPAADLLRRLPATAQSPAMKLLLRVVMLVGLIWMLRIPLFFMGQGSHAMDAKLGNWLVFLAMLIVGIMLQFGYIGLRFSRAYETRLALVKVQNRLDGMTGERDALLRLQHAPSGALASQIAHEINQPLAAIQLSLESSARQPLAAMSPVQLEDLLGDIDRISVYLDRTRTLASGPAPQLRPVSADDLLADLSRACELAGLRAQPHLLAPTLPLHCDATLLSTSLIAVLKRLTHGSTETALTLSPVPPGRAGLRVDVEVRASVAPLGTWPQETGAGQAALPLSAADADLWLDLLTLEHLARAHAGHLSMHQLGVSPPRLQLTLVLPTVDLPGHEQALVEAKAC